ncbi:hypothetical protein ASN_3567 [Acetobacter senegalensis]|uniref:Uncharacterized protein n=1 Tax=Acetobacter senegalensis TaxID=446692 RepID=A0A0U5F4H6_9PROT|nr:YidB family protein [Acetobacter senegalensis]CEF42792.1 hypothetical protein ASN_3567 [Acetobacter senegalensis]
MKLSEQITSAATQVGDFLTFATQDESGLLSVINDILGPVPQPDHPSKLEERAEAAGMIDVIRYWQTTDKARSATPEEIQRFFTKSELDSISEQTGLSEEATMSMMCELLPRCIRRRALHMSFTRSNPTPTE